MTIIGFIKSGAVIGFGGFCKCFISGKKSDRLEILFRFHNAHADTEL